MVKWYVNTMVKSPFNCVIFLLTQPQVANQLKNLIYQTKFLKVSSYNMHQNIFGSKKYSGWVERPLYAMHLQM